MPLRVEDVLVQRNQVHVVTKQQVQILERLRQEEALHLVAEARVASVPDVADGGVTGVWHLGVFLEGKEDLPAPVAVLLVFGQTIQHKQTLQSLRSQQVVSVQWLSNKEINT